jgi:hypothetical protein
MGKCAAARPTRLETNCGGIQIAKRLGRKTFLCVTKATQRSRTAAASRHPPSRARREANKPSRLPQNWHPRCCAQRCAQCCSGTGRNGHATTLKQRAQNDCGFARALGKPPEPFEAISKGRRYQHARSSASEGHTGAIRITTPLVMDREQTDAALALLDNQIAHCERLIVVQESRVAASAATFQDITEAQRVLDVLRRGLTGLRVHRRAIANRAQYELRHKAELSIALPR